MCEPNLNVLCLNRMGQSTAISRGCSFSGLRRKADHSGLGCSLHVVFLHDRGPQSPSRLEEDGAGGVGQNTGSDTPANGPQSRAPEGLFTLLDPAGQLGPFLGGPPMGWGGCIQPPSPSNPSQRFQL